MATKTTKAQKITAPQMGDWISVLPCINCGQDAVVVGLLFASVGRDTLRCQRCYDIHYLSVKRQGRGIEVQYLRYNLRYPLDHYDESEEPPFIKIKATGSADEEDCETFSGPIVIYPRKKRFTKAEKAVIWNATHGTCHICGRKWKLEDHRRDGYHIDHVIPHDSGGKSTEKLKNMRVACAKCNLRKGKGYSEKRIKVAIMSLVEKFFLSEA